jgi:hypothetical protein
MTADPVDVPAPSEDRFRHPGGQDAQPLRILDHLALALSHCELGAGLYSIEETITLGSEEHLMGRRSGGAGRWSGRLDSNQRPPAPKAGALPLRHAPTFSDLS